MRVQHPLRGPASAILLALALAAPAFGLAADRAPATAQAALPSDAQLEAEGARIGRILIDNRDVFDLDVPAENTVSYRLANRLHRRTRRHIIRDNLLFRQGDPYSRRLLEESARRLRSRRYLGDALVEPVRYHDGLVDIRVTSRDVWSLNPGLSFGRSGGTNRYSIEFEELNFAGTGVEVALSHLSTVDRDSNALRLADHSFFGGTDEAELRYADNTDGDGWTLAWQRPFVALDSRGAGGFRLDRIDEIGTLYSLGKDVDRYRRRARAADVWIGWSAGLDEGWVRRWSVGVQQDQQRFLATPGGSDVLPTSRDLLYPWIGFELLQDAYTTQTNRDQIGRTEDVLLGTRLLARIGRADRSLSSDRDAWIYQLGVDQGMRLPGDDTLFLHAGVRGRQEYGGSADLIADAKARFYHPLSERNLLFAQFAGSWGHNLNRDQFLLLGGDSGLRGYPLRYQGGDRSMLFSLEQRYFTDWYPFQLFRVGAAAFVDIGRTWGNDGLGTPQLGLLKDVGVGLRLGNTRSSLGSVIHVDLAFPLDGDDSIKGVQLLVEAKREF